MSSNAAKEPEKLPSSIFRVLVVDDSAVIRGLISRAVQANGDIKVVASAANGEAAVSALKAHPVDVIILDIEMPVMDGLTAIPLLKAVDPGVQIIMASTLTQKNAEISIKAMSLGATDYLGKPTSDQMVGGGAEIFNADLVAKVRTLAATARRRGVRQPAGAPAATPNVISVEEKKKFSLRPMPPAFRPEIIAISSSTGGPQALHETVTAMGADLPQPIVITQHMPASFTRILGEHLSRQCHVSCKEGEDSDILKPGCYYLAPGEFHMQFVKNPTGIGVKLNKNPPENFCRPAADPMLRSLVEVYGRNILSVVLTGMGQDGWKGSDAVVKSGGAVVAQDEATSVVWGMPGAVAMAGICSMVLPLPEIGKAVRQIALGGKVTPWMTS